MTLCLRHNRNKLYEKCRSVVDFFVLILPNRSSKKCIKHVVIEFCRDRFGENLASEKRVLCR
jgi:hypothetical protein